MNPVPRPTADRWARFAAWEADRLRATPADLAVTLTWLAAAWELAERHDPEWGSVARAMVHWRRGAALQRQLARAWRPR